MASAGAAQISRVSAGSLHHDLNRPRPRDDSPVGIAGAAVAAAVAVLTLVTLFRNPDYNKGVVGAAVWFLLGIAYYAGYGRHKLMLAPEEESAFRHRQQRPPA